jgi:hypothetical protein
MRYITALLLLSASFLACRHLLDENPKDQVFVDNFFQTENDATAAVKLRICYPERHQLLHPHSVAFISAPTG